MGSISCHQTIKETKKIHQP